MVLPQKSKSAGLFFSGSGKKNGESGPFFETAAALFLRAGEINHSAGLQWEISGRKTDRTTPKI
jgi:hypothetical protein